MINQILTAAAIPYRRARFPKPPETTYAVYTDDIERDGADGINLITRHNITVELYEYAPDDAAEQAIEDALDAAGREWSKQDRYWIQPEQLYQTVYEFNYFEKRR